MPVRIRASWDSDRYSLGQTARLAVQAENDGDRQVVVRHVDVHFSETSKDLKQSCSIPIKPGQSETVHTWDVRVEPWAARTSALTRVDVSWSYSDGKPPKSKMKSEAEGRRPLGIYDAEPNGRRIFVSHSNHRDDAPLVRVAVDIIKKLGFEPYVAEEDSNLDKPLHTKILENVLASDGILLLLTKHGMESVDVREELGYARMRNSAKGGEIKIMPLVEEGVKPTGLLLGAEYKKMDARNLRRAADAVAAAILDEFCGRAKDAP